METMIQTKSGLLEKRRKDLEARYEALGSYTVGDSRRNIVNAMMAATGWDEDTASTFYEEIKRNGATPMCDLLLSELEYIDGQIARVMEMEARLNLGE